MLMHAEVSNIAANDAPEGALTALLCEDNRGRYALPFPCRYSEGAWLNDRTGELIDADVIGWREWRARR